MSEWQELENDELTLMKLKPDELSLTQRELAVAIGCVGSDSSVWETGRYRVEPRLTLTGQSTLIANCIGICTT